MLEQGKEALEGLGSVSKGASARALKSLFFLLGLLLIFTPCMFEGK